MIKDKKIFPENDIKSILKLYENENTTNIPGEHGITISVIDGLLNANETEVTLGLSV